MASVITLEQLKSHAQELGLEGPEAVAFIEEQQNIARDERDKECDLEKTRLSLEQEKIRLQHEIEIASLSQPRNPEAAAVRVEQPKLPLYRDDDDLQSFFIRFERVYNLLELQDSSLAVRLASALTGKAAEIYTSITGGSNQ